MISRLEASVGSQPAESSNTLGKLIIFPQPPTLTTMPLRYLNGVLDRFTDIVNGVCDQAKGDFFSAHVVDWQLPATPRSRVPRPLQPGVSLPMLFATDALTPHLRATVENWWDKKEGSFTDRGVLLHNKREVVVYDLTPDSDGIRGIVAFDKNGMVDTKTTLVLASHFLAALEGVVEQRDSGANVFATVGLALPERLSAFELSQL
ncbi:hypothetical protein HY025_00850 [Candidatus Daviesbacteria bacterium]|nr:hypothetical protein [Candidatus Daviesbacteria bacterium]